MADRGRRGEPSDERAADAAAAPAALPPAAKPDLRRLLAFLRKLPHDFGNAILPFRIAGDLLRRAEGDSAVIEQVARILDEQSDHAQRLIEDLDRTSKVLRGELVTRARRCDLDQVVAQGVEAARRHVSPAVEINVVKAAPPVELVADPTQIAGAIEELVDNAARFAGHHPIQVETERDGDTVVVRVRDEGSGIAPDRLEQVFDPFVAADSVESGWGIGLCFVRLVATNHGGTISAAPGDHGQGLVMTLRLPAGLVR
jgi:signal transduction histidine kinase